MSAEEPGRQEAVSALPGQLPPTTSEVQAPATQPTIAVGQPTQQQQASAGAVAENETRSTPVLTMDQGPPEYSDVVKQPQGMVPFQQGMVPVQYVQQPGQQGMVPVQYVQQPGQRGMVPVQYVQQPRQQGMVPVQYVQQPGQQARGMGPVQQPLGRPVQQPGLQQQGLQQPVFMYVAQQPPGPSGGIQQPPIQPVPYMVQAPMQPFMASPRPPYSGPHDFLIFSLMVAVLCAILNLTSLACGIPAVIFAVMSRHQKDKYQANFASAKSYSSGAIALIVACIIWTLIIACLITGLVVWSYYNPESRYCRYTYSYYGGYTYSCDLSDE